ncbi:MAG: hypothetical protein K8R36_23115 [Planctomycetales bacterium]|nr:hypothetical protein [Planctomycetales bacterium]
MSEAQLKSSKPSMPLWLLLVTLLGGAFLVQRGGVTSTGDRDAPPPAAVNQGDAKGPEISDDRMLAPLREFLGLSVKSCLDKKKDHAELVGQIDSSVGLLESLVVMMADPIETAMNYRFDLQLDTLHKALGAEGYVPDHYFLPWNPLDKENSHRRIPGVLLYRRNGPSVRFSEDRNSRSDLLLVYLVGETPTSGVHKEAFLAAVRQIETLRELGPNPDRTSRSAIKVAGPVFTGGADSLALAIRQAREQSISNAKFQVITGTAVSIDLARFRAQAGKDVDLHATVLSGRVLKQALINHVLERQRSDVVRIAWLTETATGYGSSVSVDKQAQFYKGQALQGRSATREELIEEKVKQDEAEEDLGPSASRQDGSGSGGSSTTATAEKKNAKVADVIEFRFPVNISRVRSGYAESRRRERANQASLGPETSRLPIPFEDSNTARDVPPMQTPKVTAPTVELILDQILTTIRSEGIKFVGISSSDPRDPIFLAELIKEQCPDVQIMLVTSDLLHIHSEYRSIMHGTLVSSTHPLQPEAQDWCFPFGENRNLSSRSVVLSSQPNYGFYNAVLFLRGLERGHYVLTHSADGLGSQQPDNLLALSYSDAAGWPTGLPLGYSMPFQHFSAEGVSLFRPPVWISRISPNGICPITVRPTDRKEAAKSADQGNTGRAPTPEDKYNYTLLLQIQEPPDKDLLPKLQIRSHVPTSLTIASLLWLLSATIYCLALLFPASVGNWAKALQTVADHPGQFHSLVQIFRSYITGSFLYLLMMFGTLFYVYHRRVAVHSIADLITFSQGMLCYGVATVLSLCLLADWGRALGSLVVDVRRAIKQLMANWSGRTATAGTSSEVDLSWHLIAVRGVALTILLGLVTLFVRASILQRTFWLANPEDSFLWFKITSDMWNGLSSAMTAQFLAVSLIILAYGLLLQMHLLSPEFTIIRPDPSRSLIPSEAEGKLRQEEVRNALLFPLLSRWRRNRPVVFDILCIAAALLWLVYLGGILPSPDYFALPVSFATVLLLFIGGLWCVRLFKLIQILKGLIRSLDEFTKILRKRWPESWTKIFEQLPEKRVGLQELFWTSRPSVQELVDAQSAFQSVQGTAGELEKAEQRLCAIEMELYARQFFHHIVRMGLGLALSACLLFLTVQAFPFSQEPLLRLSSSIMLAAIGCVMTWYYLKLDRNELLSHLVGTDPKQISINWSMIQMIAPAVLLTAVALLSHTFPEIWQWVRGVLEPMSRSSI